MSEKKRRGRPATGQNTKVIRVPKDMNREVALQLYYDILPSLVHWKEQSQGKEHMPRYDALCKLLAELNMSEEMMEEGR